MFSIQNRSVICFPYHSSKTEFDIMSPLTFSHYGRRIDGPLSPAFSCDFLGPGRVVGQGNTDDGHGLGPRPVAVRVRADDLRPRDMGL